MPECVRTLVNLREMFASENALRRLPRWIEELPLFALGLNGNRLVEFPSVELPLLALLYLRGNQLTSLPCSIKGSPLKQ